MTFTEVLESITYHPESGVFTNKFGRRIGSYTRKYGRLFVGGKQLTLSRLAVFKMKGKWPDGEVDHIDRDTHNDKWNNLRECSHLENMRNQGVRRNNKTGFRGVVRSSYKGTERYNALSTETGVGRVFLGQFRTPEEAAKAYDDFVKANHGAFASLNFKENV